MTVPTIFIMGSSYSEYYDGHIREHFRVVKVDRGCTFLQDKQTGREFLLKEFNTNSSEEFAQLQTKLKVRQMHQHPHVLSVHDVAAQTENTICSHVHRLFLIVEYPFRTLQEEIDERAATRQSFSENELWSLIYSCSVGLGHLYAHGLQHQAVTSGHVYVEGGGLIKISDPELMNQPTNLSVLHTARKHPLNRDEPPSSAVYPSPEELQCLSQNRLVKYAPECADMFSLGVLVLECLHLRQMGDLYEEDYRRISPQALLQLLDATPRCYSDKLRHTVAAMLRFRPQDRITFQDVERLVEGSTFNHNGHSQKSEPRRDSVRTGSDSSKRHLQHSPTDTPRRLEELQFPADTPTSPTDSELNFINRSSPAGAQLPDLKFINRPQVPDQQWIPQQDRESPGGKGTSGLGGMGASGLAGQPTQQPYWNANPSTNLSVSASMPENWRFSQDTVDFDRARFLTQSAWNKSDWQSQFGTPAPTLSPHNTPFPMTHSTPSYFQSNPAWTSCEQPSIDSRPSVGALPNSLAGSGIPLTPYTEQSSMPSAFSSSFQKPPMFSAPKPTLLGHSPSFEASANSPLPFTSPELFKTFSTPIGLAGKPNQQSLVSNM